MCYSLIFLVEERNSITGENSARRGNGFNITRVARQFEELYNEEVYSLTLNTSLLIKLNTYMERHRQEVYCRAWYDSYLQRARG